MTVQNESRSKRVTVILAAAAGALFGLTCLLLWRRQPDDRDPARMGQDAEGSGSVLRRPLITDPGRAVEALRQEWARGTDGSLVRTPDSLSIRENVVVFGDRAVPSIQEAIARQDDPITMRLNWVDVLAEMNGTAAEQLLTFLLMNQNGDEKVRCRCLVRLKGRKTSAVVAAFRKLAGDPSGFPSRELLLRAVADTMDAEGTKILMDAARSDKVAAVRLTAVELLGARRLEPRIEPGLAKIMEFDADPYVRLAALTALRESSDPTVRETILRIRDSREAPELLRSAAKAAVADR